MRIIRWEDPPEVNRNETRTPVERVVDALRERPYDYAVVAENCSQFEAYAYIGELEVSDPFVDTRFIDGAVYARVTM